MLLVGFDTLTYRIVYDRSPTLVGHKVLPSMYFAVVRSGEPIPIYNGKDYPYWKDKMKRNIIAINSATWYVVKNGVNVKEKNAITREEAKKMDLDSEVWVFISNHLILEKYHE